MSVPIFYAISFVVVSNIVFQSIFLASLVGILANVYHLRAGITTGVRRVFKSRKNFVPLSIGLAVLAYFIRSVVIAQWPEPGDIGWVHGPLVALISYYGKLPDTWFPVANLPLHYPPGFHVVVAFFNTSWRVYPGQAVFIYGASIIPLLTLLVYCLSWIATRSLIASVAGALSVLYVSAGRLDTWIGGYFYNGPYPNLLAFLLVVFFCGVLLVQDTRRKERGFTSAVPTIGFLCSLSLFMAYPPFAAFPTLGTLAALFLSRASVVTTLRKQWRRVMIGTSLAALAFGLLILIPSWSVSWTFGRVVQNSNFYALLPITTFAFSWFGIIIIMALSIAFVHLVKREFAMFSMLSLLITLPALASYLFPIFVLILPNRSLALAFIIAPVGLLSLARAIRTRISARGFDLRRMRVRLGVNAIAFLVLLAVSPSVLMYATGSLDQHAWFPRSPSFSDDFNAMRWLADNVPSHDLILNDLSYASLYLPSLKVFNLTFGPVSANGDTGNTRGELYDIWQNPHGYSPLQPLPPFSSPWIQENPWGNGQIGQPLLNQSGGGLQIIVPPGSWGYWGLHNVYHTPENFTGFEALAISITSNRQIGLSIALHDGAGKTARYDLRTSGTSSEVFDLQLNQPTNADFGFNIGQIVSISVWTGYIGPFPQAGDSIAIQEISARPNLNIVKGLLSKFNVRYIWVSSEWGMVPLSSFQGLPGYVAKPYSPFAYDNIFQEYDFLTKVHSWGNSTIFLVNK